MKKFFCILGMLCGVAALVFAFTFYYSYTGVRMLYQVYGGDAYTGIQQSAAQTATNVVALSVLTRNGITALLILGGAGMICFFGMHLFDDSDEDRGEMLNHLEESSKQTDAFYSHTVSSLETLKTICQSLTRIEALINAPPLEENAPTSSNESNPIPSQQEDTLSVSKSSFFSAPLDLSNVQNLNSKQEVLPNRSNCMESDGQFPSENSLQ